MKIKLKIKAALAISALLLIGCQEQGPKNSNELLGLLASSSITQSQKGEIEGRNKTFDELSKELAQINTSKQTNDKTSDSSEIYANFMRKHVEATEVRKIANRIGELDPKIIEALAGLDLKSSNLSQQLRDLESKFAIPDRYRNEMQNSKGRNTSIFQTTRVAGWVCRPFGYWVGPDFWSATFLCAWASLTSNIPALLSFEVFWF